MTRARRTCWSARKRTFGSTPGHHRHPRTIHRRDQDEQTKAWEYGNVICYCYDIGNVAGVIALLFLFCFDLVLILFFVFFVYFVRVFCAYLFGCIKPVRVKPRIILSACTSGFFGMAGVDWMRRSDRSSIHSHVMTI